MYNPVSSSTKTRAGISIIEIIVVIAVMSIALASLLVSASLALKLSVINKETTQANELAQETIEAVRSFRNGTTWAIDGIGTLATDPDCYHPEIIVGSPSNWSLVSGEETIGIFKREIVFSRVFRDTNDNISETGSEDSGTRKVTVIVSWEDRKTEIVTYLTNWKQ